MTDDLDLRTELDRLAQRVEPPHVAPYADRERGRRRLIWRRLVVGGAGLLVAGVVGGVFLLLPGHPSAARDPRPAGSSGTPTPSPTPSSTASPTPDPTPSSTGAAAPSIHEIVAGYHQVLAEDLDPDALHLQPYGPRTANQQVSERVDGSFDGVGSKFGWRNAGQSGLGMLEVFVSRRWNGIESFGPSMLRWQDVSVAGGTRAQVDDSDGVLTVRVQRADGLTVALVADPLFGNNSLVGVSSMELTQDQLLQAAADPRLTLPAS